VIDFQNNICDMLSINDFNDIYIKLADGKDLELLIVDDESIRELNRQHRGLDKATDVLSFPVEFEFAKFLGSIVISYETASKAADEFGHTIKDEAKLLFIHGMLHLLGFDHESDNGEMRIKEQEIIRELALPLSLTERNS